MHAQSPLHALPDTPGHTVLPRQPALTCLPTSVVSSSSTNGLSLGHAAPACMKKTPLNEMQTWTRLLLVAEGRCQKSQGAQEGPSGGSYRLQTCMTKRMNSGGSGERPASCPRAEAAASGGNASQFARQALSAAISARRGTPLQGGQHQK